ncbi:MAG: dihydroorotate dehydrogenase electron transfer subunit [Gammaproteobacteria bacterium]|nr:dihydroorotate dehydrogenase electron transfer subunit [Gammaproteobacteria bacterium]
MDRPHRNTIFLEEARVLALQAFPAQQFVLRLEAPQCAARAMPGAFVHLQCAADIPMRRPLSIRRSDPQAGWIEILFKVVGPGLQALAAAEPGDRISTLGPIGQGFAPDRQRPLALLVGGGVGIPPLEFLAIRLAADSGPAWRPVAFFGSEVPFPFKAGHATTPLHGLDHRIDACQPDLEALGVPSRLASLAGFAGCYPGYVTALAGEWLASLHDDDHDRVALYACGPQPMLRAVAGLARDFGLPAQLCLEEYMACGVGGCAGCAVPVQTDTGPAMKRVCVDGPVFEARAVYPELFRAG